MSTDPFYRSRQWLALRAAALEAAGGACEVCGAPAVVVDHRVSRRQGGTDTLDNLRCLCRTHDNGVKEDAAGKRRRGGRFVGCDAQGNPLDPQHWWHGLTPPRENLSQAGALDRPGGQFSVRSIQPSRRGR